MTDTSKDAVARLCLAMINSGNTTTANMLKSLADERDAANARAEEAERENEAYLAMNLATVAERAENGGNPVTAQMRLRKAEEAARDAALVDAAGTLEAQALDADAQAKRFRGGSDPWADRTARSRALRSSASIILALRDKPAPAVTVQKAILEVWGCCEELEDEALAKLSGVKTEHEKGFWTGQKMTAKRIRRATQMPIAGGGDE